MDRGANGLDRFADPFVLVRRQVVHHHDISTSELRGEPSTDPIQKSDSRGGVPKGAEGDPGVSPDRADQRQVVSPVSRAWFDQLLAAPDPRVRSPHRQICARFIDEDQAGRVYLGDPVEEGRSLVLDIGSVGFRGPRTFF